MKTGTITGLIIFLIIGGAWYMLLTNAHMDFFPGISKEADYMADFGGNKIIEKEKSVSLLAVSRGDAELNVVGYIVAFFVIVGLPFLIAYPIGRRMNRKAAKRKLAQQQSTLV